MRVSRFLLVLLALGGCARPGPHYGYMAQPYPAAMPGAVYAPQQVPISPMPAYQQPVYQAPVAPAAVSAPAARGLFGSRISFGPPAARGLCTAPGCAAPGYGAAPPSAYPAPIYAPAYQAPAMPAPGYAAYPQGASAQTPYSLDAGDRLRITVFGQEGLTNTYAVDAAGQITMPLIGAVPARGLTPDQLSQAIAERLRQGYIREPHVAVEIEAYRPFFIHGEVTNPGQYPYVANMTVENAVAIAGGFTARADKSKITVSRSLGGQTVNGTVALTYPLRPGDTLRIQERWF